MHNKNPGQPVHSRIIVYFRTDWRTAKSNLRDPNSSRIHIERSIVQEHLLSKAMKTNMHASIRVQVIILAYLFGITAVKLLNESTSDKYVRNVNSQTFLF